MIHLVRREGWDTLPASILHAMEATQAIKRGTDYKTAALKPLAALWYCAGESLAKEEWVGGKDYEDLSRQSRRMR